VTALGLLIALAAAVANAFAVVLQAEEDRQAPLSEGAHISLFAELIHRPRWVAGTSLMVVAWPLQILALTLAPITVVQPALSATQLVLLGVARVKLGERVGRLEITGALAIVLGVATVVWAAPHHSSGIPGSARVAPPLIVVGLGAIAAYVIGRRRPRLPLAFVIGAGLAYAWVDFANKLLANDLSLSRWGLVAAWLAATVLMGALAFLQETTALQRRPAVTVAPVVGAVQDPLPVVLALWAGVETWGAGSQRIIPLIAGLAVSTAGAVILGRSQAVARAAGEQRLSPMHRPRLAACAPNRAPAPAQGEAGA
jgi:drug/metabolite transporter (DMT)-like permease